MCSPKHLFFAFDYEALHSPNEKLLLVCVNNTGLDRWMVWLNRKQISSVPFLKRKTNSHPKLTFTNRCNNLFNKISSFLFQACTLIQLVTRYFVTLKFKICWAMFFIYLLQISFAILMVLSRFVKRFTLGKTVIMFSKTLRFIALNRWWPI